jgi:predicted RNA-binding Zn-ribbon protein involved in translation (DUF1610 family)
MQNEERKSMSDDFWDNATTELAHRLMVVPGELSLEQNHPCPVCGNRLIIHAGRYQRYTIPMIGVTIECKECNKAIAIDSMEV